MGRGGQFQTGPSDEETNMTQEETYQNTIVSLHKRIEVLEKEKRLGFTPETLDDIAGKKFLWAWALLEHLGKKKISCDKCGSHTKPISASNGFLLMVCVKCNSTVDVNYKKKPKNKISNAYFDNDKEMYDAMERVRK